MDAFFKEREEEERISRYWKSIREREALEASQKEAASREADRVFARLCQEVETKTKAKEEEEALLQRFYVEEQLARSEEEQRIKQEQERKRREDFIVENERQIQIKVESKNIAEA